ncbi:MAG TPA: MFS transporter [Candidatus Kapabacteria bacterium]|nr:MFS transporter [Candidatus Kapabacteria bacterium]
MESDRIERDSKEKLPKNVVWLSLAAMFNDMSGEIIGRALPLFLAGTLGISKSIIGLIEGFADTTSSIFKILSGWYSDKWGKRQSITAFGYSLTTVSRPLLLLTTNWVVPFISRFLDRTGKGIRTSPRDALIADSVAPEMRGRAFGLHRALDPLGAVFGAIGAAVLLWQFSDAASIFESSVTISEEAFKWMVIIGAIPTVISALIVIFLVKDVVRPGPVSKAPSKLLGAGIDKRFNKYLLYTIVFTLGASSDAFLLLRAQSLGVSAAEIFLMIAGLNIVTTLSAYPAGIISDKLGRKNVIVAGWIYYALMYAAFAFATESWHMWLLFTAYGLFYGLTEGVEKAYVADLVLPDKRGAAFGLYNGAVGIILLPASLIAGVLWQSFGPQAPFVFGAVIAMIGALLLANLRTE